MNRIKMMAAALIVAYILITWIFGCVGIAMSMNRGCPVFCVALYGTFIFLFVAIPLMAEGSALHGLKRIDDDELSRYCSIDRDDLDDENRMVQVFIQFAHRFDRMSESVLNEYMCTETCPCFNYN